MRRLAVGAAVTGAVWIGFVPQAHADRADVVGIGDSILGLTKDELAPQLEAAGWTDILEHTNGSGLTAGTTASTGQNWFVRLAELEAEHDPDTVTIVLGTNDAIAVQQGTDYGPLVDLLLDQTDARRVLWATCTEHSANATINEGCRQINAVLRSRERIEIVPYEPEITTSPTFGGPDSVHPGPEGQQAFADLEAQMIGAPK